MVAYTYRYHRALFAGAEALMSLLLLSAWLLLPNAVATGNGSDAEDAWLVVPRDDLNLIEAFSYAFTRINEMRMKCSSGFKIAPLHENNYRISDAYRQDHELYSEYKLHIMAVNELAPTAISVHVARQNTASDYSLFQVIDVAPPACDLYSLMDDASLMVPVSSDCVIEAKEVAYAMINQVRAALCPERPQLQFFRVLAATLQPTEGKVVRLVMEMREAASSFETHSFAEVVSVVYALDQNVPVQCTTSPEVYPARAPCEMKYNKEEQSAGSDQVPEGTSEEPDASRLLSEAPLRFLGRTNRASAANADPDLLRPYVDAGLDLPDDFDPRLDRTLCFPRGISRQQGTCGSSWAFAATAVASFRECLWYLRAGDPSHGLRFFSAQELVSCMDREGCSGGDAATAFYYMKYNGIARASCSPYHMRCFLDNSILSTTSADFAISQSRLHYETDDSSCPVEPDPETTSCRCLPSVFHLTMPLKCESLPDACEKTTVPHYFRIAGTAAGNTVPEIERHIMQELFTAGPLYVSLLIYEDVFDPVSWTESGIYQHRHGGLIGKHAAAVVGWGTDFESRDYWLLFNSFGDGWQQQGYFKVMRGETRLQIMKFDSWGVDFDRPQVDKSKPHIFDVEVSYSARTEDQPGTIVADSIHSVWITVSAHTDEPSKLLVRIQGLSSTIVGESRVAEFKKDHVLHIDLLKIGLLNEHARIQIWAVDHSENTGTWGPYAVKVPSQQEFRGSGTHRVGRRLLLEEGEPSSVLV